MKILLIILFLFSFIHISYSQFKGESGVYYLGSANVSIPAQHFDNPDISGVVIRFRWNDTEKVPDNFDWSFVDAEIEKAIQHNKKVSLQPLGVPNWLAEAGAKKYYYIDKNQNHSTYGQILRAILPWDSTYIERYKIFLLKLSEKYSGNSAIAYINTIGGAFSRNLPDSVVIDTSNKTVVPFWTSFDYDPNIFAGLINKMTDYYMELFPETPLLCSVDYVRFELQATGNPVNYLASLITNYGITNYPYRFGLFREDLSACNPPSNISTGSHWYIMKDNKCRTGIQMLWSVQDGPERMNKCGVTPNEKATVLDSAINKGIAFGIRYMEIYAADIIDSSLKDVIKNANLQLKSLGYSCDESNYVDERIHNSSLIVPNPAVDYIEIDIGRCQAVSKCLTSDIKIYNTFGECVMELQDVQHLEDVGHLKRINISHLPVGLYFIQSRNYSEKFMVLR